MASKIYSHSRLSTFEQCQLKFKFKYLDKLVPEIEQTIEGFLGNKVHETLEWIYKSSMNQISVSLDEAIEFYLNVWKRDFNNEIKIVNQEKDADFYLTKGVRFIIDYYQQHFPFKENTIAVEKQVFVKLDNEGKYLVQGYIDRLVYNNETNILEIHDYKTGGFLKSQEELDKDRQLALYSMGIRNEFSNAKDIYLIWHFLDFNKKLVSKRTDEQLDSLKQEIIALINKIESTKKFLPNQGILCNWCEFRKYCEETKAKNANDSPL